MKAFMGALALCASAQAQTVVYDTFNEADQQNLFDCCNSLAITAHRVDMDKVSVAIPFTPAAFAKIIEVDLPLVSRDITKWAYMRVEIAGSTNGLPGKAKKVWHRLASPVQQCCEYLAFRPGQAIHAEPVGQYWVIVGAQHHDQGGWDLNTAGYSGPYAVQGEDGVWTMTEGPLPAVRIIAK
jgi:hypothetical protein